jgi:hypothetical protein
MITRRDMISAIPFLPFAISHLDAPQGTPAPVLTLPQPIQDTAPDSSQNPRVIINPGHNLDSFKRGFGCHLKGVGFEYELVTGIAAAIKKSLEDASVPCEMTRSIDEYSLAVMDYQEQHRQRLEDTVNGFKRKGGQMTLPMVEAVTELAIANYAQDTCALALLSIHINDVPLAKRGASRGFVVAYSRMNLDCNNCRRLADDLCSSLKQDFLPSNNLGERLVEPSNGKPTIIPGIMDKQFLVTGPRCMEISVPATLIECGYITERYGKARETIAGPGVQERYAQAISRGVQAYLSQR